MITPYVCIFCSVDMMPLTLISAAAEALLYIDLSPGSTLNLTLQVILVTRCNCIQCAYSVHTVCL